MNIQSITAANILKLPKMNSIIRSLLNRIEPICVILFCMVLNNLITFDSIAQNLGNDTFLFLGNKNIAPVIFLEDGMPRGVAVDIVYAVAKHIPHSVEFIAMDWQEAQGRVLQGKADALIQINQTEERKKIYDFSDALLESQFSIFVHSDRVSISGISSLRGLRVGVEAGGLPQQLLDKNPNILLTIIPNFLEGFKLLDKGILDAVVVDYRVGSFILAENNIRNIKVTGEPIAFSYSAIAVKKGNTELLREINTALRIIKADGTYRKILEKWKQKETVFYTQERITQIIYHVAFIALAVGLIVVVIWMLTLRSQLTKRKAAELKLKGQYSTLHGIIDSANALIFSVDKKYKYTSFNKRHASVMKVIYGAEIEIGSVMLDYMTVPEDRETAKRNFDRALAGEHLVKEAYSGEELRSRKYFQVSHTPIKSEEEIIGVAVLAQDLTERKQAEEALLKSEAHYYDLFEDSPISLWEEDFSEVKQYIDEIRERGVEDVSLYFENNPVEVLRCSSLVKVIAVNQATLDLFKADSKKCLLEGLSNIFTEESLSVFKEELITLANGINRFQSEAVQKNMLGEKLHVVLKLSIAPGYENSWEKVFISISDITDRKQIEEAIRKREHEFLSLAENSPDNIMRYDIDCRMIYANSQPETTAGYYESVFMGKTPLESNPNGYYEGGRAEVANYQAALQAVLSGGGKKDVEMHIPDGSGGFRLHAIRITAERDSEGNIVGALAFGRDITERKQAEEALTKSEEWLRLTLETANIGIWDWDVKNDLWYASPTYYTMLGYEPKFGNADRSEWIERVHPEDITLVNEKIQDVLTRNSDDYSYEARMRHSNGTYRWQYVAGFSLERDENSKVTRMLGIRMDIEERMRAEEALLASERRYRTLVENTPDLIVRYNTNLRRVYVNPAWEKASGLSAAEVINVDTAVTPKVTNPVNPKYMQKLRKALDTGTSQVVEFMWENAFGENLFLEYTISPEFDRDGKVISLLCVGHDITALKKAEKEHLENLRFFEYMNTINRIVRETNNLEEMMSKVLESVLSIFDCDRAFLLYPCDPETQFWQVPMECSKPEYPGVKALGLTIPIDANVAETFRILLESDGPIKFGPHTNHPLPAEVSERFNFKSLLSMAIFPKVGKPWQFGLHQCSYAREWTKEEERLLQEIGRRLSDAITSLLTFRELQESEWKYREIFDNVIDALYLLEVTGDGRFRNIEINPALERLSGIPRSQSIGKTQEEIVPESVARIVNEKYRRCVEAGHPIEEVAELDLPSGKRFFHSTLIPARDVNGRIHRIVGISRDITDQKQAETEIIKLNRIYSVLSNINQAVVRITDLNLLLSEVCRIAIENGKFCFVWIGLINLTDQSFCVSATSGYTSDFFDENNIELNNELRKDGPIGKMIRSGYYFISNDVASDDNMTSWREEANKIGYKSVASFPIVIQKVVRGTINIYSNEVEFFNRDEIQLLDGMAMDVSFALEFIEQEVERKKAEEKLFESEAKFSAAFRYSPSALSVYSVEKQVFLDVNIGFLRMTGYKREEVIGHSCHQLHLPVILASSHMYQQLVEGGEYSLGFEDKYINKYGELRHVFTSASIINVGDEPCIMAQMIDITERKKFEDALKDSEEKYRKLAQTASDSIITINKDGLIVSWNEAAEKTFGYSSYEVIGKEMQLILPQKHRQIHTIALDELKAGREPKVIGRTITVEAIRKNGDKFPIELSLSSWESKTSVFYTAIIRDISERSEAELELETYRNHLETLVKLRTIELNKANESLSRKIEKDKEIEMMLQQALGKEKELNEMKSRFISTISHEFRTPLTSIFSSTELIQVYGSRWSAEKKEELFERIKKSVKYLTRLLDDVLTISRTETGKISFQPEQLDLKKLAQECIEDAKSLMNERHHLKFSYKTRQKLFYLDTKLLRFILSNLLSNALKYSPNGGDVELKIWVSEKYLLIEISDEGIGIPPEEKEMIFQPFYRTKNIETIAGTGLGLTIVDRAVILHNGEILVQSELNKGTTFTIRIPKKEVLHKIV